MRGNAKKASALMEQVNSVRRRRLCAQQMIKRAEKYLRTEKERRAPRLQRFASRIYAPVVRSPFAQGLFGPGGLLEISHDVDLAM